MASPQARTGRDGAKQGMAIMTAIQAMKNIMVFLAPNLSWHHAFTTNPASWPTSAELDRPDCHAGVMSFSSVPGSYSPKRSLNCVWP